MGSAAGDQEVLISVDIETAGPTPREYSLLSIGACTITEPVKTFYVEIQPISKNFLPEAMKVNGLSLDDLQINGLPPSEAMSCFADWLESVTSRETRPIFVAFNAPFDWMFVNDYFHHYHGHNPFGHNALDIKAYYMGLTGCGWLETSINRIMQRYFGNHHLTHHALQDALDQAEIFRKMLAEAIGSKRV